MSPEGEMNLRKLFVAFREYRAGAPLGDVVVLKLDALSAPPRAIARELRALDGYAPTHGSAPGGRALLFGPRLIWSLLAPGQARRIWHNLRVGRELGGRARLVIAQPLESWFEEPLEQVRARLGIPDPQATGILASGASLLADALYRRKPVARVT